MVRSVQDVTTAVQGQELISWPEREVSAGHSRAMLCLLMSKTTTQGHRLLTGGADGYAKLWVSAEEGGQLPTM